VGIQEQRSSLRVVQAVTASLGGAKYALDNGTNAVVCACAWPAEKNT
jgi:hypothetical protein